MTIVPKRGRFGVKVWDRGRKGYRWIGTFPTEEAAQQAEQDATAPSAPSIADWGRIWLREYPRQAPATRQNYAICVRRISSALGRRSLDDITRLEARRLAAGWSHETVRVARAMWNDAVRDDLCAENPWSNLRKPRSPGRKDLDALTEAEITRLAEIACGVHGQPYGTEVQAIIITLGFTGIRPGELCALRLDDLDFSRQEMTVRQSLDATRQLKLPKNGKERTIVIPPPALEALRAMPLSEDGYVFHTKRGRQLSKSSLHYAWRPVHAIWCAQGGRDLDLYDLRHACATNLLERGVQSADVAVQLGHPTAAGSSSNSTGTRSRLGHEPG